MKLPNDCVTDNLNWEIMSVKISSVSDKTSIWFDKSLSIISATIKSNV